MCGSMVELAVGLSVSHFIEGFDNEVAEQAIGS